MILHCNRSIGYMKSSQRDTGGDISGMVEEGAGVFYLRLFNLFSLLTLFSPTRRVPEMDTIKIQNKL